MTETVTLSKPDDRVKPQSAVPSTTSASSVTPLVTEPDAAPPAKPPEVWRNPILWLVVADVFFVVLAGWIALAGHSPLRWLGVLVLMLLAGSVGFFGYFFPSGSSPATAPTAEPKDKRKIRVHFVDELPKSRK